MTGFIRNILVIVVKMTEKVYPLKHVLWTPVIYMRSRTPCLKKRHFLDMTTYTSCGMSPLNPQQTALFTKLIKLPTAALNFFTKKVRLET